MTNETHLDTNPSTTLRTGLSLRPVQWADLNAVAQFLTYEKELRAERSLEE